MIENKKLFLIFEYIDKDLQKYLKDLGKESLTLTQVKVFIVHKSFFSLRIILLKQTIFKTHFY